MAKHLATVEPAAVGAILADAKDRAARTAVQNVGVDVAVAAGGALFSALESGGDPFTSTFWVALGLSVGKTALLIAASYVMRLKKAPSEGAQA